ncbi:hypothetical protein P43SY_001328 [Pythium insidiosum]|uniref:Complex 1 LYR protein domain-containing protein n=1 Tax=Pythium insidiosum TaxID=114742 RepID=A0AAD5M0Q5_PYTIN|nr:hypothetical protein P43SY_001328 [Pythium insidiosum]
MSATGSAVSELRPLYKKLLRLAKSIPDATKRESTVQQIRAEFRSHLDSSDPKEISALLQRAQSKIGFLKIVTPRERSDSGRTNFVYMKGERVDGDSVSDEGARYKTADFESNLRRHNQLLRRQHFLDRGVAPPKSIF